MLVACCYLISSQQDSEECGIFDFYIVGLIVWLGGPTEGMAIVVVVLAVPAVMY